MLISIGILAHNEEHSVVGTIDSLLSQSVFGSDTLVGAQWEVVVVANGCTDRTHETAEHALSAVAANRSLQPNLRFRVHSLARAGKSNAWNELIHNIMDPATAIVVMIDADIEFGDVKTIENAIACLLENDEAKVVVDLPLNDLTRKKNPNFIERVLARASWMKFENQPPGVAGSFYCARASTLREIWMPIGLPGEDGFLAAMIMTDCFRSPPVRSRVIRAQNASHYYEGLSTLSRVLQHEIRLAIGTALNIYLCWYTLVFLTAPTGPGAGELIRALNEEAPTWYEKMMASEVARRGFWVLPRGMLRGCVTNRFRGWRQRAFLNKVAEVPLRAGAIVLDFVVLWLSNRKLRNNVGVGYW